MQQLTTAQLKTREQAEQYLKVEENTQYLTHLIRYTTNKRRLYHRPELLAELKSVAALIVQFSYLLFTCCVKQVNLLVAKQFLLAHPSRKENLPEIHCEYLLEKDFTQLKPEEQKIVSEHFQLYEFAEARPEAYGKYVLSFLDRVLSLAKPQFEKLKIPAQRILAKQFLNLEAIRGFLLSRIQQIEHPRIVILSFQESEIFRQHSILVKVMNNSIFSTIKNSKHSDIFTEICKLEQKLIKSKEGQRSHQQNYSLEIEATIEELLRYMIKIEVIVVEQSISNSERMDQGKKGGKAPQKAPFDPSNKGGLNVNAGPQFNPTAKQYMLGEIQQTSIQQRLYKCRIHIAEKPWRQFNEGVYKSLCFEALNNYNRSEMEEEGGRSEKQKKNEQGQAKNQFIIQFMPAKGLLIVKYITPIELNIENTDLVMFQCNNIAYHWSNVNMELVQKSPNKLVKKKERYLSLKTITHLNISDRPLFKMLLMIDLVMLCAKIAEPELKKSMIKTEDYYRIQQISNKVNHMINLFIRKIERYYKIVADNQISKLS